MFFARTLALCAWTGVAAAATAPVLKYSTYLREVFAKLRNAEPWNVPPSWSCARFISFERFQAGEW
jgi:hypothetical protein